MGCPEKNPKIYVELVIWYRTIQPVIRTIYHFMWHAT